MTRRAGLLLVAALVPASAGASAAAQTTHADRASWLHLREANRRASPLAPEALRPAPARLAALQRDGQAVVDLVRRHEVSLAGGRVEDRATIVRHFVSDEGVRQHGNLQVSVRIASSELWIEEAWVSSADGRRQNFDFSTIQIQTGAQADVFSDLRVVVLPLSGLAPGSTVVLVTRTRFDERRWPLPWARIFVTQAFEPTELFEVTATWASPDLQPRWKSDDSQLRCELTAGGTRLGCQRRGIPPIPTDPDVQNWLDRLPQLVLGSAANDWGGLAARMARLVDRQARADAAIQSLARRLTSLEQEPRRRIGRLHRFVSDQIRYVAVEHGSGAVVPRPARVTFDRRYGDCKDKVTLFVSLARAVGLDAHAVLVGTAYRDPAKLILPSPQYFDHMVACVRLPGEETTCMDPTAPQLPAGTLPFGVRGAVSLPLVEGPKAQLTRMPADRHAWQIDVTVDNVLRCDGSIQELTTRQLRGAGAGVYRAVLRGKTEADRRRWLEEGYAKVLGDKVKPTFLVQNLEDPEADLVLHSAALFPSGKPVTELTQLAERDFWLVELGSGLKTSNRHHSYDHSGLRIQSWVGYQVCPDRQVEHLGAELDFETEFGSLRRRYHRLDGRVQVSTVLDLPAARIAVEKLERFNRFLNTALDQSRVWFSLAPASRGATP